MKNSQLMFLSAVILSAAIFARTTTNEYIQFAAIGFFISISILFKFLEDSFNK